MATIRRMDSCALYGQSAEGNDPGMPQFEFHPSRTTPVWGYYQAPVVQRSNAWSGLVVNGQYVTHEHADFAGIWGHARTRTPTSFSARRPRLSEHDRCMLRRLTDAEISGNFNRDGLQANCFMRGRGYCQDLRYSNLDACERSIQPAGRGACSWTCIPTGGMASGLISRASSFRTGSILIPYCNALVNEIDETGGTVRHPAYHLQC